MRITQIMLGKGFGGAERSFVDTALALAERGHSVQAICHRDFVKRALLENVPTLQLNTIKAGGELDFLAPKKIARLIRDFQPEIVHTQLKRAAWHGGRGAHLAGVPTVAKLHNYVELKKYRYVHTLIGTTEDQRQHALTRNWPADRIAVIPNFSRVCPIDAPRSSFSNPLQLLTYGRYVYIKGFDLLLRAFKKLLDEGVNAELTIGGSGPELQTLTALATQLGICDRIRLGVWVEDVTAALDQADFFVLPSRTESFGIVLLEAMARGIPIIASRAPGPTQVLNDQTAFFCDLDSVDSLLSALRMAISNKELALLRAGNGLELYKTTYHENTVIPKLEALYRSVIPK